MTGHFRLQKMQKDFLSKSLGEEFKFLVQKMVPNGVDVIIGSKYYPEFGAEILSG